MRILALLVAALAAGCTGVHTSGIAARDNGVFVPHGRVAIDISPRPEAPSHPHTGHAIEVGVTGGQGDDRQDLAAGNNPVVFGGRTFAAPVQMTHDFEFRFAEVGYRYRHFFGKSGFGIEGFGGLGYAELDLTVTSATQSASENLSNGGIVGAFGLLWSFRPSTSLQSRIAFFGSGQEEEVSSALRIDAYLVQAIGKHAALRAGYTSWAVRSARDSFDASTSRTSPINLRFSGPALGLELMF